MKKTQTMKLMALQSRDAVELLSDKWRIPILHLLTSKPLRTKELQASIPKLSPKVLTQTLRGLERDGLIHRTVHNIVPPHVEYQLTLMGKSAIPVLHDLCLWAEGHAQSRDEARRQFDQIRSGAKRNR